MERFALKREPHRRVMVLGATGFIGGQIARAAHAVGWEVRCLRRRPEAVGAVGDLPIGWYQGDLSSFDNLIAALSGCDILFHAAGYAPGTEYNIRQAVRTGVTQMRIVLGAAREAGVTRVIYTSSLSTIGPPPPDEKRLADERDGYLPGSTANAYYEAKWLMEYEAVRAVHTGLPVVTLAPTAVFGPGDVKPSTGAILLMAAKGQVPLGIDTVVNIVDGRDVAEAHIQAVEQGIPGQRYIVGGHNLHVGEALRTAARFAGVRPPRRDLSIRAVRRLLAVGSLLRLPIPATMRAIPYWQPLNDTLARETFGVSPRPVEETIRDTIEWFRARGYV
jgi:dihydroflavonol-4-reductase